MWSEWFQGVITSQNGIRTADANIETSLVYIQLITIFAGPHASSYIGKFDFNAAVTADVRQTECIKTKNVLSFLHHLKPGPT